MFSTDVAARGIDIPDVDWIIQLSSPKDPAFFIHRIGRTARAGKCGSAILFITLEEISYIELLKGRGVPLKEMNGNNNEGVKVTVYNDKKEEVVSNILNEMAGQFNVHNKKSSYL
jgi:superfamily II DNA/RNA helicase